LALPAPLYNTDLSYKPEMFFECDCIKPACVCHFPFAGLMCPGFGTTSKHESLDGNGRIKVDLQSIRAWPGLQQREMPTHLDYNLCKVQTPAVKQPLTS